MTARRRSEPKGMVLWMTGLSGSGKSTLAEALARQLRRAGRRVYVLDGDVVRRGLCSDLGFSAADRRENNRRVAHVAAMLAGAGVTAIVAFISPFAAERRLARSLVARGRFLEVFVDCPREVCERRDPKGLYARVRRGKIRLFTGISSPYERPRRPDVVCRTDIESIRVCVARIRAALARPPARTRTGR